MAPSFSFKTEPSIKKLPLSSVKVISVSDSINDNTSASSVESLEDTHTRMCFASLSPGAFSTETWGFLTPAISIRLAITSATSCITGISLPSFSETS